VSGSASQIHTLLSLLQVAIYAPEGLQATLFTSLSCPSREEMTSKVSPCFSQITVVASKLTDAIYFPSGDLLKIK
jgi:hypothetical protein